MTRRIDGGAITAALGAVLLFVSLFLDWFEPDISAWTAFEALDMLLAAMCLGALAIVVPKMLGDAPDPLLPEGLLPVLGVTAFVIVGIQLLNHPPAAIGLDEELGAWLGLGGSVLLLIGSVLWRTRISFSISTRDRAAAPAPRRTAPGATAESAPVPPPEPPPPGPPETATRRIPDDQNA
jgi:hypothetical protein